MRNSIVGEPFSWHVKLLSLSQSCIISGRELLVFNPFLDLLALHFFHSTIETTPRICGNSSTTHQFAFHPYQLPAPHTSHPMAPPPRQSGASTGPAENPSNAQATASSSAQNPTGAQASAAIASASRRGIENQQPSSQISEPIAKKKRHRGGKKHKKRRQSFAADPEPDETSSGRPSLMDLPERASEEARDSFYRLGRGQRGSATSLESEALLDHRYV